MCETVSVIKHHIQVNNEMIIITSFLHAYETPKWKKT